MFVIVDPLFKLVSLCCCYHSTATAAAAFASVPTVGTDYVRNLCGIINFMCINKRHGRLPHSVIVFNTLYDLRRHLLLSLRSLYFLATKSSFYHLFQLLALFSSVLFDFSFLLYFNLASFLLKIRRKFNSWQPVTSPLSLCFEKREENGLNCSASPESRPEWAVFLMIRFFVCIAPKTSKEFSCEKKTNTHTHTQNHGF